ncbi:MAG: papain-like cysteine peptidase, partial [Treponema sp.]|nr:papain-like cysteine peptidase [Treponema sp.]
MKIHLRNIVKAFMPYGLIILHRKYNDYKKIYKKENIQKGFVFDIIISVGQACRTAHYLKKHGLRFCANPLDWMTSYSLDTVIHLYKTRFNDFFMDIVEDKQKSLEHNCHWYIDCKNNIVSMHYDDIEDNNKSFREKMENRFEKINQVLLNANTICFISCRNENI